MNRRFAKFFGSILCSGLIISTAKAADYTGGVTVDSQASHNDNFRLTQNDKIAVNKYDVSPKLIFGLNTETDKLEFNLAFDFNRYNRDEYNSNDQSFSFASSHQFENSSIGLNASYIHNTTNTSELLTSGRIGNKADRAEQYTLSPTWSYSFNEINLIQLTGGYTTQNYQGDSYIGYKNSSAELDWIHLLNDRTKLVAAATYSDYKSEDINLKVPFADINLSTPISVIVIPTGSLGEQNYAVETKSKGMEIGIDYQWSEESIVKARLGRTQNRTSYSIKDPGSICTKPLYLQLVANLGSIGGACGLEPTSAPQTISELDWTWSGERQQFSLSGSKAIQATSNGYAVDAIQAGASWSYALSELDKILASTTLVRNRAINNHTVQNASIADRDYGSATLQYQRQLSEQWFFNTSFEFSEQKYTQQNYRANSRVVSLGILYHPAQWHWSR